ncbi:MAG: hypothetical protein PGN37_11780 [Mycobacterium kyogaense]|jgi:hypothetical protein|uniref:hypothetical protein n=1 Tax=Mycobacterium kyogaense TaxID=2212479 RepID=UPI002FFD25F8
MSGLMEPSVTAAATSGAGADAAAQLPVLVHSCSRLGRVANPPGFSFSNWFRSARRR